jgi:hypothetical protein
MATIVTRAGKGSALTWTEGDANITNLNNDKIESIVEDTTPQLGGNLDVNGNSIVSTSNGNIVLAPNGSGKVRLAGLDWPTAPAGGSGFSGNVTSVDGSTDRLNITNAVNISLGDQITFAGGDVVDSGLSTSVTYFVVTANDMDGYIQVSETSGGSAKDLTTVSMPGDFTWSTSGAAGSFSGGEVLTYSSTASALVWQQPSGGGGGGTVNLGSLGDVNITGLSNGQILVYDSMSTKWVNSTQPQSIGAVNEDTSPQLGGNLNVNGNSIVSSSNGNIAITPNGTGQTVVKNLEYNEFIHSLGTTSGTITPNATNGNVQTITLNGNLTFSAFSSPVAGQSITLIINTNGTGRTLTSTMLFAGGEKTLSTTSTTDIISVFYDGTNYWASLGKDFK